jgi:Mg/Co/Ni transporter MgtE
VAALMPIVAGIGGNSGNQTITMIVRAMALDQVNTGSTSRLMRKELAVGLINGLVWGGVIGVVAYLLYGSWSLGVVMTAAMTLNLLLAALMGVLIPMTLARLGRDPAMGASVMITAMTRQWRVLHLPGAGDDLPALNHHWLETVSTSRLPLSGSKNPGHKKASTRLAFSYRSRSRFCRMPSTS